MKLRHSQSSARIGLVSRWALLAPLVTIIAVVTACAGSNTSAAPGGPGEPVTISFQSYTYGQPNPGGEGLRKLIAEFETANPNVTVNPESVPVADVLTKLQADAVAGEPPDVAQIGWSKVAQASRTLPLRAFDDVAPASEWQDHITGIIPSVLAAAPVSEGEEIVAMPFLMATPVLYYNAELFRTAGLDPEQPPTTISEVKQAALTIKSKAGADGVYFGAVDPGKSDYLTQSLVASAGGGLVTDSGEITVDSAPVVRALSAMQDLTRSGAQPAVDFKSAQAAFSAGKLGMLVYTAGALPTLDSATTGKFSLRVASFPGFEGQSARPTFSGSGLAILAEDDDRAQAAWKFVQFLTNDTSYQTIASEMGYLPLRSTAASAADERLGPALEQLASLTPYTSFPGKQTNQAVVILQDEAVEPVVLRGADPAKTLSEVDRKIRSVLSN